MPICRSDWLAAWPIGEIGRLADWMLPSGALEVTKVLLFIVFPIRFAFSTCRSYQICYAFPSCALEVTKVLLFIVSTRLAPSKLPKSRHFLSLLSCAFEVTKVSEFIVFSIRLAPSRSPKCRHFRFPLPLALSKLPKFYHLSVFQPTCALEVTKVSATVAFLSCLVPSKYQSVAVSCFPDLTCAFKVTKVSLGALEVTKVSLFHRFFHRARALEITKVSLLSCCHPVEVTKMPLFIALSTRPASLKLPECNYLRVPLLSCALEVTKVSLFLVLPTRPATSRLPKCPFFRTPHPVLRPRSFQSVITSCFFST